ncbi:MAG: glycerol-3-phosphate 1-O-acyltransferase PlsY [Spirulinaceae cyanobacterium RM2_2_10]|nr:glycerol-3-phosphate 1-O-acyltransferase PlsY [Spirulinaceae cyanobacterium RM2_2_10]
MVANLGEWLIYALLLGYVIGSIPFGLVLTRAAGLGDIREIGSGNIGATNVLRTGNKGLAAATLVLDGLKATCAVLLANHWYGLAPAVAAGLGAFIGHLYPVWLGFKGGKGVATYIGALLGLFPSAALTFVVTWIVMAVWKRYSSLSALVAACVTPIFLVLASHPILAAIFTLMTLLLFWKHRANISRLRSGDEPLIGVSTVNSRAAA